VAQMALRLEAIVCAACHANVVVPPSSNSCPQSHCQGSTWLCPRCGIEATLMWGGGAGPFSLESGFGMAEPTSQLNDVVCYKCHPADEPRQLQRQPRPGMLARAKGSVWEVKQTGMNIGEAAVVLWANLAPINGGEQRAAYSTLAHESPPYLMDGEAVTFEG
jgi:hypothetical protein